MVGCLSGRNVSEEAEEGGAWDVVHVGPLGTRVTRVEVLNVFLSEIGGYWSISCG